MGNRRPVPIHVAVSRTAAAHPEHPAVLAMDGTVLTYRQLEFRSDDWAHRLSERGVTANSIVPVLMSRSAQLPVLLLAVLKCGAAYAGVDHRWPAARVGEVLALLKPPLLVVDREQCPPAGRWDVPLWCPPTADEPDSTGRGAPRIDIDAGAPASVFFTSGTTGVSQAVVSPHRATTRLFDQHGPLAFGPGRVMPFTAFAGWDAASLELWGMLTTGGTSVVVADDYLTPQRIAELVQHHRVNTLWLTASLFNLAVAEDLGCFAGLQQLYVGGERLSRPHVRRFVEGYPKTLLYNGYGPVESCVFGTVHPVTRADAEADRDIPIGRPVLGTEVLVLDGDRVCGPGEPGELGLAGDGLALGYLGEQNLTRAGFTEICDRERVLTVYRTGDRGFRDAAGTYHFIGRTDRQIKLRGHRIELDGIEAEATALLPLTRFAAVALPGRLSEYDRLVLFYAAGPGSAGDPLDVRRRLADRLPPHAVPDVVTALDRLPINANGKIDYEALRSERVLGPDPWFV